MSPLTHFVGSWLVAAATTSNARDRRLVTLAGVLPDVDGLGAVVDIGNALVSGKECTFHYYQQYHHLLLHGWPGALFIAGGLTIFARQKPAVFWWCLVTFHLHLICDLLGSRGPDISDLWPIGYSEPLFRHPIWFWKGQWRLDGWQNMLITAGFLGLAFWIALKRGYSFVGVISKRMDEILVQTLRKWFKIKTDGV